MFMGVACDLADGPARDDWGGKRGMCRAFTPMSHWEQTPWHRVLAVSVTGVECIRASSRSLPPCRPWQVQGYSGKEGWRGTFVRLEVQHLADVVWGAQDGLDSLVLAAWTTTVEVQREDGGGERRAECKITL